MDLYRSILDIAKLLLAQADGDRTAQVLLQRLVEATEAHRGFIVVRDGNSYDQKFDVQYDRRWSTPGERKFSRSLVRKVIASGTLIDSPNLMEDARFAEEESARGLGACAVLVVPLRYEKDVWGVVYLERQGSGAAFSEDARQLVSDFAEIAGLCLRTAFEKQELRSRSQSLERDLFSKYDFKGFVTQDPKMLELLSVVAQVADSDATVLILGESGSGKELIAQALHCNGSRSSKPLVALHCAALPTTILESELFGHARGAFSGADRDRKGHLASADGGTLFLDEIAEIAPEVQAKLLRFLQFGEIQRVGSDRIEKVNVRVIAATLQDLPALVRTGKFRQDLYYRINIIELKVPPLRERRGDVPLLVEHFLSKHWKRKERPAHFTAQADRLLRAHAWPGNVRELEHVIQRISLLATSPQLDVNVLPEVISEQVAPPVPEWAALSNDELKAARERAVDVVEHSFLTALMERHAGSISKAARESGLARRYLQRLLTRHRITNSRAVGGDE